MLICDYKINKKNAYPLNISPIYLDNIGIISNFALQNARYLKMR